MPGQLERRDAMRRREPGVNGDAMRAAMETSVTMCYMCFMNHPSAPTIGKQVGT